MMREQLDLPLVVPLFFSAFVDGDGVAAGADRSPIPTADAMTRIAVNFRNLG